MNKKLKINNNTENYKGLDKFLEEEFIPDYVQIVEIKDEKTQENNCYPWVELKNIQRLELEEQQLNYILEYLNNKGIYVSEYSNDSTIDNVTNSQVTTYQNQQNEKTDPDTTIKKFLEYNITQNKEIREKLIIENMRLVSYISFLASKQTGINVHELESYGYEGLIKSVNKFDPNMGYKFSSYAYPTIKGYILNGIREIRGYSNNDLYRDFYFIKSTVEKDYGMRLKDNLDMLDDIIELLIEKGTITTKDAPLVKTNILLHEVKSLDEYLDIKCISSASSDEYLETDQETTDLSDDNTLYLQVITSQAKDTIEEVLNTLSNKKKIVIKNLFGLEDGICHTEQEVSKKVKVSRARVSAMKISALRELRHPMRAGKIIDYLEEFDQYNYEPNQIKLSLQKKK